MDDRNPAAGSPPGSRARGQVDLLRHNPRFRALWASRFVSFTGDSLSIVALLIYLAGGVSGPLAVALLMIVTDFLPSLLSPLAGAIADRIGLRRVMVTCDVLQAALVALIALTLPPLPILLVLVALRSITATIFQPASRAAVPALVKDRDLERATRRSARANLPDFAGPVLAAVLFGVVGVRGLLLLDSLTFVLSALLLLRLPAWHRTRATRGARRRSSVTPGWVSPMPGATVWSGSSRSGSSASSSSTPRMTSPWSSSPPTCSTPTSRAPAWSTPASGSACWRALWSWGG
jgi:MFS family permease